MNLIPINWLLVLLVGLIVLSGLFSCAETSLMALNRYRLRHLAHKKNRAALRLMFLLKRPDRVLGVILLGNTFANVLASSVATIIAVHYWGDHRIWLVTIMLTFVILIFAEIGPKTLAALYPQRIAFPFSWPLSVLLKVAFPVVWLVNGIANFSLRIFGVRHIDHHEDMLTADELRTIVHETRGKISNRYQKMLLRILDLGKISVEDVMVPRNEIYGIDLAEDWSRVESRIMHCPHHRAPVYRESFDQLEGVLNIQQALLLKMEGTLTLETLKNRIKEPYFVPEGTFLNQQLRNFEKTEHPLAFVVDEYGDIQGLINLNDILQEIIGEFSADFKELRKMVQSLPDGVSYLVDASVNIRDLNHLMDWRFPTKGPKTLSGLIIEKLEAIPHETQCLYIAGYPVEICEITENTIHQVKIFPRKFADVGIDPA